MIRFQNKLREMRTYEIPVQAGAGFVRQKVDIVRRKLVQAGEGQPNGSLSVKTHRESVERKFPTAITLSAHGTKGDTSEPLPDRLAHMEPFKSAIEGRRLAVLPVVETPAVAESPADRQAPKAKPVVENKLESEASASTAPSDLPKTDKPADAGTTTKKQRGGQ